VNKPYNKIDDAFKKDKTIKLMTHIVAGYPDLETSFDLVKAMEQSGADLVEIQIPFSDPMADGPVIMKANQTALNGGTTPDDCFRLAEKLSREINIPLLFMTYGNIPYAMGMEQFIERSASAGIEGLIVPDLPFDENVDGYYELAAGKGLHPIFVLSSGIEQDRLARILPRASGFLYSTLKTGTTGAGTTISPEGLAFAKRLKESSDLPLASGFGISKPEHVAALRGISDAAIVGSKGILLLEEKGIRGVTDFLSSLMLQDS